MLSVKLVVVGGDAKSKEVQLKLPTVIGRGREGVSLTLPHKLVSRKHTEIFEREGALFVRDMGSLNGTFVNNQRIQDSQLLKPNELLTLGNVTFRAVYDPGEILPNGGEPSADFGGVDLANVLDDSETDESTGTDKSKLEVAVAEAGVESGTSDIFSGEEIEGIAPDKSISMSAIDGLPTTQNAAFEVQLDGIANRESIKHVEIELDEPARAAESHDSKLGSFLKKMPR